MQKKLSSYNKILMGVLCCALAFCLAQAVWQKPTPPTPLEAALQAAGKNRAELEKVLRRYRRQPADSLKYKAACFLIENMPFYAYQTGEQFEHYKVFFAWLKPNKMKTPQEVADSVRAVFGPMREPEWKHDIQEVDSAYLCRNIEWAFKVWQEQPWGKNVSFDRFCECLLPYRIEDESLADWREKYYEKYNPLLDSLRISDSLDREDPAEAARYLMRKLEDKWYYYTTVLPYPFGHIGPDYVSYLSGSCREVADFAVYLFRSVGIPCAIDRIPTMGGANAAHFWLSCWDKYGELYVCDFPEIPKPFRRSWLYRNNSPKVYRSTFSVNRNLYGQMAQQDEEVYPFWRLPKFTDVTDEYAFAYKKELSIPLDKLYKGRRSRRIAYLCITQRDSWIPVDWTEFDTGGPVFHNVRTGAVMRVATYEDGKLNFLTDPFVVDKETGESCYYPASGEKQDVVVYAKKEDWAYSYRMQGGIFEGSNRADFAGGDTLFIIQKMPNRLLTVARSWSDKAYRYLRYVGPEKSHCNVAEVAFYAPGDSLPLRGKCIGTPGCWGEDGMHEYTNVFDGDPTTSFDYKEASGGWAGLDLGKAMPVDRIVYTLRNRDNYVRPGDTYELYYCDRIWKSAGRKKATSDSLVYKNIPKDALLYLRNHTRGVDDRVFLYQNGVQQWK